MAGFEQLSIPVPGEVRLAFGRMPIPEAIARAAQTGSVTLDGDCPTCIRAIRTLRTTGDWPMGPAHRAKDGCLSGKHPHCTCDTCF